MKNLKPMWLCCTCGLVEHQIRITDESEPVYPREAQTITIQYHLSQEDGILKRLKTAIGYVFGRRSRWGDFGNVILSYNDVDELWGWLSDWLIKAYANDETLGE